MQSFASLFLRYIEKKTIITGAHLPEVIHRRFNLTMKLKLFSSFTGVALSFRNSHQSFNLSFTNDGILGVRHIYSHGPSKETSNYRKYHRPSNFRMKHYMLEKKDCKNVMVKI